MESRAIRVEFAGSAGRRLVGWLELPAGEPRAAVALAHCFTCGKDLKALVRIAQGLAEAGFAVLRFDFAGLGESRGEFAETDFSSNVEDLIAAAEFLGGRVAAPLILAGHSLGGAAALVAASRLPRAAGVALIAAASDLAGLRRVLLGLAPDLEERGEGEIRIGGRRLAIRRELLADLERHDLAAAAAALGRPLLVLHSPDDELVPIEHAHRLFAAAAHPKSLVCLDGADHLLGRARDSAYAAALLALWAGRVAETAGRR